MTKLISTINHHFIIEKYSTYPDPGVEARSALRKSLFADYDKYTHPENLTVKLGIALIDVNLDAENNLMVSNLWLRMVSENFINSGA